MRSIIATWGTPFDEEDLVRIFDVARSFMGLISQLLDMFDCCIRADNVEELLVVCNEVGFVEEA